MKYSKDDSFDLRMRCIRCQARLNTFMESVKYLEKAVFTEELLLHIDVTTSALLTVNGLMDHCPPPDFDVDAFISGLTSKE